MSKQVNDFKLIIVLLAVLLVISVTVNIITYDTTSKSIRTKPISELYNERYNNLYKLHKDYKEICEKQAELCDAKSKLYKEFVTRLEKELKE